MFRATIPALPARDVAAAAAFYRERFGFDIVHQQDGFAVLKRDGAELAAAGVLHRTSRGGPADTDFGTREFATLDGDGNLLTFFQPKGG